MITTRRKNAPLTELEAARVLINRFAPNLFGKLPRAIFRYHPEATERWLDQSTPDEEC